MPIDQVCLNKFVVELVGQYEIMMVAVVMIAAMMILAMIVAVAVVVLIFWFDGQHIYTAFCIITECSSFRVVPKGAK